MAGWAVFMVLFLESTESRKVVYLANILDPIE
jgi:hypothetical protein